MLDREQGDRYGELIQSFQKQVNAAYVDPTFVERVRKKLRLGQKEAGEIFGGGINAFSRYENGKSKPPLSLVKLLKVLDKHPDLLDEVRFATCQTTRFAVKNGFSSNTLGSVLFGAGSPRPGQGRA